MHYTVTAVERKDQWPSKYGREMVTYAIRLEGEDGWIKLNQLATTPPPKPGDHLTGSLQPDPRGEFQTFKKEFNRPEAGGSSPDIKAQLDRIEMKLDDVLAKSYGKG